MSELYGFRSGPTLAQRPVEDDFAAMMDEPMSLGSTFWDQTKGGVLESFGLGTAIRTLSLPPAAQTRRGRETAEEYQARQERVKGITEEEYKSSPFYRSDVPWDRGMTMDRAAALAAMYDTKKVREYFAEKRPFTSFFGGLAGQAVDPINYIPIAGPAVKAASVAKFGTVAGVAATAALDAAANTAIAGLATRETRRSFGDDVSWQTMVTEIATAALIGSAFGTLGGVLERRAGRAAEVLRADAEKKVSTLKAVQESRIALNEAIGTLANDGEVRLSPNAVAPIERAVTETISETTAKAAPPVVFSAKEAKALPAFPQDGTLYHGSPSARVIDEIKASQGGELGKGLYISREPEVAVGYSRGRDITPNEGVLAVDGSNIKLKEITRKEYLAQRLAFYKEEEALAGDWSAEVANAGDRRLIEFYQDQGYDGVYDVGGRQGVIFPDRIAKASLKRQPVGQSASPSIDASPARPETPPVGRAEVEASVAKAENYKALADQYRVDPEAGTFPEEAELRQLAQAGRLSDEDMAALDDADAAFQDGAAYGEALKATVNCLI